MLWALPVTAADVCVAFADAEPSIVVEDLEAVESSGVAASRTEDGVYYTHDDNQGDAVLHVFRSDGSYVGEQTVYGATNEDWEDLANGPCPAAVPADRCLWIADIGDNDEGRGQLTLWVVPENLEDGVDAVACHVEYPAGTRSDAEALLVDPDGSVRIVTKEADGHATVYRLDAPACDGTVDTLVEEAEIELDGPVTGGAVAPDGGAVVLRTLTSAWLWTGCRVRWASPETVDLGSEPQGEGITFTNDGGLLTSSEGIPFRARVIPCAETDTVRCCGCATAGPGALLPGGIAALAARRRAGRRRGGVIPVG